MAAFTSASLIALATKIAISVAISVAINVLASLLFPKAAPQRPNVQNPSVPTPADGKYNLKQNVPPPAVVFGRVKKGGDYATLRQADGTAQHVTVWSGHRNKGFVSHYLHDESVTLDGSGYVVAPAHFGTNNVRIQTRAGLDAETAYASLVAAFPGSWTNDHRGDGLASVLMSVKTVNEQVHQNVFPQGMPVHTVIGDGAHLYDPREETHDPADDDTWEYSQNLALGCLFHMTHPSGFKLGIADLYLPDWIVAADESDDSIINRDGVSEPRYHGGFWWRMDSDAVEVGRTFGEAGELMVYERPDGLIGVHPGRMVAPDIRLTVDDFIKFHYAANRGAASTVLAVRGRWTDPDAVYNTVDAAIWGDPYTGDDNTQRTRTVDNAAVQRHNHMQRLQKLKMIRANAPRVAIVIPFDALSPTRRVRQRRFIKVHYPSRGLDEAIVEIMGRPKLSLRNLTISFEGIVVPEDMYEFDGATEEGAPGVIGDDITGGGIPAPENFTVGIDAENVSGGLPSAFARATWDYVDDALTYELEYQFADASEPHLVVFSRSGETEVRTVYLKDGTLYRFRMRTRSGGGTSDWTDYIEATAVADETPPDQPTSFGSSESGGDVTLAWRQPNSVNLYQTKVYRGATNVFADATLIHTSNGGIDEDRSYVDPDLAAGTHYFWVRSFNASGIADDEVGPVTETI